MSPEPLPSWIFVAAGAVLVLGSVVLTAGVKLYRRVQDARASREMFAAFLHSERCEGIPPERAALITGDAESAAWQVALGHHAMGMNPHPARTREFVLWEASFHSAMSDLAELAEVTRHAEEEKAGAAR